MTNTDTDFVSERVYSTPYGEAYRGDSREFMWSPHIDAGSVDLIFCSPPYALTRAKDYPNESPDAYIEWFETFLKGFDRILGERGSLVIDIGGSYLPGEPKRSTYHFKLACRLAEHFDLCQEFYWYNPAKLPSPAEWVNIQRVRVKDSVNLLLWFAKDAGNTKANNERVLKLYSESMENLLSNGYQAGLRPSNHDIGESFLEDHGGAIPPNLLGFTNPEFAEDYNGEPFEMLFPNLIAFSNTASNSRYLRKCREHEIKPHSARFPVTLPAFFIQFLTEEGDLVFDPFSGSNATGEAAEEYERDWLACDLDAEGGAPGDAGYVATSSFRFEDVEMDEDLEESLERREWSREGKRVEPEAETS